MQIELPGGGAQLGVRLSDVGAAEVAKLKLAEERGALVRSVEPDSAAARAGVKEGDVVLRYQGEPVASAAALQRMVRETPAGRQVALEVWRAGALQKLSATLDERGGPDLGSFEFALPVPPELGDHGRQRMERFGEGKGHALLREFGFPPAGGPRRLGIEFQELSGQLAAYFKVEAGLLVTSVDEGSAAARAGLQAGDVITKLDGRTVDDARGLREAVLGAKADAKLKLGVVRAGRALDLEVALPGAKRESGEPTV